MVKNIDNKINLIQKIIKIVVDPAPTPIMAKVDTGETSHYFTPADNHALVNIQQTNMKTQVRLPNNSKTDPQQV